MSPTRTRCLSPLFALLVAGVMPAQCPSVTLAPGVPQSVSCSATACSLAPAAGTWNVVGVTSADNWNLVLVPAISNLSGTLADFAVANGHLGAMVAAPAVVNRVSGSGACAVQHAAASALTVNIPLSTTFAANHVVRVFEFTITDLGWYSVSAGGNSSGTLHWDLYAPGPNSAWRPRNTSMANSAMNAGAVILLAPGTHALVVVREAGTNPGSFPLTVSVTCGDPPVHLVPGVQAIAIPDCQYFEATPAQGRFNVIGVASFADWNVSITGASSANGGSIRDFVAGYGRSGVLPAAAGTFTTPNGFATGRALHAVPPAPLALGTTHNLTWDHGRVLEVLEFQVTAAADYRFVISGPQSLNALIYSQLTIGAPWRPRNAGQIASANLATGIASVHLPAGWYAMVIVDDTNPLGSGTAPYTIRIEPVAPVLSAVSPGGFLAGGPAATILVSGSHFNTTSRVWWNQQQLATTNLGATLLQASVPASSLANPGLVPVQVRSSAGAPTASNTLTVDVAAPHIVAYGPSVVPHLPASQFAYTVQFSGTDFAPGAVIHANGLPLPTTPMAPGTLRCTFGPGIPQALVRGGIAFNVVNFGTVPSNTVAVAVGAGDNRGTIVRTPLQPAPGSSYGFKLEGGVPGQPLTLAASLAETQPLVAWPDPTANLVLGLDLGTIVPLTDGIGVFGPASGAAFAANPSGTPLFGEFQLNGFVLPVTPLGIDLSVQAVYLDPSSPTGFRLTWTRYPESL